MDFFNYDDVYITSGINPLTMRLLTKIVKRGYVDSSDFDYFVDNYIDHKINFSLPKEYHDSPLIICCKYYYYKGMSQLIKLYIDISNSYDINMKGLTYTPLYMLMHTIQNKFQCSMLHKNDYFQDSFITIFDYLLDNGANPNIINNNFKSIQLSPLTTIIIYIEDVNLSTYLFNKLISCNANVNFTYNNFTTLLMTACNKSLHFMKLLIDNGADINTTNINGDNVLSYALRYKTIPIENIQFILDNDIDIDIVNMSYQTPLLIAINSNIPIDIMKLLIDYGANINNQPSCPLTEAIKRINSNIVELLIEYNIDLTPTTIEIAKSFTKLDTSKYIYSIIQNYSIIWNDKRNKSASIIQQFIIPYIYRPNGNLYTKLQNNMFI